MTSATRASACSTARRGSSTKPAWTSLQRPRRPSASVESNSGACRSVLDVSSRRRSTGALSAVIVLVVERSLAAASSAVLRRSSRCPMLISLAPCHGLTGLDQLVEQRTVVDHRLAHVLGRGLATAGAAGDGVRGAVVLDHARMVD